MTAPSPRPWILTILALFAGGLSAQQPVFRAATHYVVVDVVVTDEEDRHVTGLSAADFEVRLRGRPQTIAEFAYVNVPPGERRVDLAAPAGVLVDVFSNAPPPPSGRAFVFVLHRLDAKDIVPIKRILSEFLTVLAPNDRVAIVFPERSDLSQDFTHDQARLVDAVNNLTGALGFDFGTGRAGMNYIYYFKNLLQSLAAARENRRALVYVGNAWPCPPRPQMPECADLLREFARMNIPVYTLDPRGLMAPELGLDAKIENQTPENRRAGNIAIEREKDSLREAAENTNGRSYVNNWDVVQAARDLMADNGSYYLLGFYPEPYEADGRYHSMDVRVRRRDLRVRAREGYLARKPAPAATPAERVWLSLGDGIAGGELQLRAFAAPISPGARGANTVLTLDIAYPAATAARQEDDELQIAWVAIDPDARRRAERRQSYRVPLAGRSPEAFTLSLGDLLDLPAGVGTLRIGVSSRAIGTQGTIHVPLDIPRLSGRDVVVTPLVIGRDGGPAVRAGRLASDVGLPFHPTTLRTFARQEKLHVFARAFRGGEALSPELNLIQNGKTLRRIPVATSTPAGIDTAVDLRATIDLAGTMPAEYVLELIASAPGREPVVRSVAFAVR